MKRVLFLFFLISQVFATPTPVHMMEEVKPFFTQADETTWALFDIDLVLVQPSEPAFQMPNIKRHRRQARRIMEELGADKKPLFLTLMALSSGSILVDPQTPGLIQELAAAGIPAMALTANLTGSLAHVNNLEAWKIARLNSLEIDFSASAPFRQELAFRDLPSYRGYYSTFVDGVLFANGPTTNKGEVFVGFLQQISVKPERIVFIDDREENLESVETALKHYDPSISFEGILYQGAHRYPAERISEEAFTEKWNALAAQAALLDP